jgi:hypothetical protein
MLAFTGIRAESLIWGQAELHGNMLYYTIQSVDADRMREALP